MYVLQREHIVGLFSRMLYRNLYTVHIH